MGLINSLAPLFKVAIISVIVENRVCKILVQIVKSKKIIKSESKEFKVFDGRLTKDVAKYINSFEKKYKFTYVGTLLNSVNQGAIKGCLKGDFRKFGVAISDIDYLCINKMWAVYGFSEDIAIVKENFERDIGVDFIFSPFAILYEFFLNHFSSKPKLYILYLNNSVIMGVFKNKEFLFGAYFSSENAEDTFESSPSNSKDKEATSKDSDDLDEELVFFEEDEDVISLDEEEDEDEPSKEKSSKKDDISSMEEFKDGVNLKNFIKSAIEEFYKSDKYETEFLDDIVIANAHDLTEDVVSFIEGELMLKVEHTDIDMSKALAKIIKKEVIG